MYITPNTTIILLKDVPLDNTYRNTIYFTQLSAQTSFFSSKMKYRLDKGSYQRIQNVVRIGINAESLYDCNYLMFQNTAFGSKWFYAFITDVEYKNNDMSEITFELDVMQSWFFDYTINMSFIEREMSVSDNIGDNLVPENLDIGTLQYYYQGITTDMLANEIIIAATFDENMDDATGDLYGGIYSGIKYNRFLTAEEANAFIEQATAQNKSNGIVSIFMYPLSFFPNSGARDPITKQVTRDKKIDTISGYTPKNKKLFTFPYNYLLCTNNEGNAANFRYEFFESANCTFDLVGCVSCTPEFALIPTNYKGSERSYVEQLTLGNYPQCAYNVDTFKAYIAQNANRLGLKTTNAIAQVAAGAAVIGTTAGAGALAGAGLIANGLNTVVGQLAANADIASLPPQAGGATSSDINFVNKIKAFNFYNVQVTEEFARIIDDYFSCYGYATHRIKVPNRVIRPHWNYVKTANVSLTGSIPANDMAKLRQIYDAGVTFWRNGSEVGQYNLDNSIGG